MSVPTELHKHESIGDRLENIGDKLKHPFQKLKEKLEDTHLHDVKVKLINKKYALLSVTCSCPHYIPCTDLVSRHQIGKLENLVSLGVRPI